MYACRSVRTLLPTLVPNELAVSLAPMAKASTKAIVKPTMTIHSAEACGKYSYLRILRAENLCVSMQAFSLLTDAPSNAELCVEHLPERRVTTLKDEK